MHFILARMEMEILFARQKDCNGQPETIFAQIYNFVAPKNFMDW